MSFIGTEIKRTRKAHGMTSRDVAERVTLTPQYVRLIECGGAVPSMPTVLAICNQFPDADSAEWLWLLLADLWGPAAVEVMRASATRPAPVCRCGAALIHPGDVDPWCQGCTMSAATCDCAPRREVTEP